MSRSSADIAIDAVAVDARLTELERLAAEEPLAEVFYREVGHALSAWGISSISFWKWESEVACLLVNFPEGAAVDSPAVMSEFRAANRQRLIPWSWDGKPVGGIYWGDAELTREHQHLLHALAEICSLFHLHAERRRGRERWEEQTAWQKMLRDFNSQCDLHASAYHAVNEGRRLLGCERVSLAIREGNRFRLIAVSGAEHIKRRAEVVLRLERLIKTIVTTGAAYWFPSLTEDVPPEISETYSDYVEESPITAAGLIPLFENQIDASATTFPFAVLVCEQFAGDFSSVTRDKVGRFAQTIAPLLARNRQLQAIPGLKFWLSWQQKTDRFWWLSRAGFSSLAAMLLFGLLFLIPADIEIQANGELQPQVRHEVFAPRDAIVTEILVDHGSRVEADQPLLSLRSAELDWEEQKNEGELNTVRKQLAAVLSERLQNRGDDAEARIRQSRFTAEEKQLEEQIRGLESRRDLLLNQKKELAILAPHAGEVLTWNLKQRLTQRPLRRGDSLLTVASLAGAWEMELHLPEHRVGRFLAQRKEGTEQNIRFALHSAPGKMHVARIMSCGQRMERNAAGENYLRITAKVPREELAAIHPGSSVSARISCGRGSLGGAWFHEFWDAVRWWLTW